MFIGYHDNKTCYQGNACHIVTVSVVTIHTVHRTYKLFTVLRFAKWHKTPMCGSLEGKEGCIFGRSTKTHRLLFLYKICCFAYMKTKRQIKYSDFTQQVMGY